MSRLDIKASTLGSVFYSQEQSIPLNKFLILPVPTKAQPGQTSAIQHCILGQLCLRVQTFSGLSDSLGGGGDRGGGIPAITPTCSI